MARRSDHSRDEIKEMALAAAERIVFDEGQAGLSARKVAAAIGYTVGTLYLVFENLDDLVLQVNGRTLDRLDDRMREVQREERDPERLLVALGHAYIRFADEQRHLWQMIFESRFPEGRGMPPWFGEKVGRMFALVEESLAPLAQQRSKKEIAQAARALWGGIHGICILAITGKLDVAGVASAHGLAESLVTNYLQGFTLR